MNYYNEQELPVKFKNIEKILALHKLTFWFAQWPAGPSRGWQAWVSAKKQSKLPGVVSDSSWIYTKPARSKYSSFWELDCGLFLTWYLVKYKWRVISPDHTLDLPWMPKNMSSRKTDKTLHGPAIRLTKSPGESKGQAGLRLIYADMILIHWKKSVKPADVIQILKTGWVTKFLKFFNFLTSHSTISWKFLVCASIYSLC